jgi:hypothetical protein
MDGGFGHHAGPHELVLCGVELERRKADCGENPLWVFTGHEDTNAL